MIEETYVRNTAAVPSLSDVSTQRTLRLRELQRNAVILAMSYEERIGFAPLYDI